jgi:hypothetical protein
MKSLTAALCIVCSWLLFRSYKTGLVLFCFLTGIVHSIAQDISIQQIELEGRTITFTYSLIDTSRGRTYVVGLYSSQDNFTNALQKTTGDVGIGITPGNKKIIWNAGEEFGNTFQGTLAFEIRSKVYVPFIRLQDFDKVQKRRRGVPFEITWTGGRPQNILRFDLLQGDQRITTFTNIANSGHCTLTIPTKVRHGENYRFKIYDPKSTDDIVYGTPFIVKRRIPLVLKVVPAAILAAAGYLVWDNSSDSEKDEIPGFPATPGK